MVTFNVITLVKDFMLKQFSNTVKLFKYLILC